MGGRIKVSVEDPKQLTSAEAYELVFAFNNRWYVETHHYSATANMFVPKAIFDKVGPFRTRVSEDRDWGERATAMGMRLRYSDDVVVSHPARHDWSDLIKKWRRVTSESYALICEKPHGKARWFARSWLVLLSPAIHVRNIVTSRNLNSFGDRAKAAYALVRLRIWRFVESQKKLFA